MQYERNVCYIIQRLLEAVSYLHAKGLVHGVSVCDLCVYVCVCVCVFVYWFDCVLIFTWLIDNINI